MSPAEPKLRVPSFPPLSPNAASAPPPEQQTANRFRTYFDAAPVAVCVADAQGNFRDVNPAAASLAGCTREELLAKNIAQLHPPEALEQAVALVEEVLGAGHASARLPFLRADGERRQVRLDLTRLADGSFLGHLLDESEQHAAEQALRESEQRFRRLTEVAQDAVILIDDRGEVTYWNASAERIFGYASTEALGKNVHALLAPGRYAAEYSRGLAAFGRSGQGAAVGQTAELEAIHANGRRIPVELSVSSVRIRGTWHAVGIVRDVSERQQMEAHLRQRQKLAAIGRLASGVAHEINNPIAAIVACAHLLVEELEPGSQGAEDAHAIVEECERVESIVERLRSFAQSDADEPPSEVGVSEMLEEALALVAAPLRASGIEIRLDLPEELPTVVCRIHRFRHVFFNLLTNARDSLNERYPEWCGDKILRVTAETFQRDERPWVRMTVEDAGAGIAEGDLEHIFDPFFAGSQSDGGTGLGLWVARQIVDEHGGELRVESGPGEPTRFHVELKASAGG